MPDYKVGERVEVFYRTGEDYGYAPTTVDIAALAEGGFVGLTRFTGGPKELDATEFQFVGDLSLPLSKVLVASE